MHQASAEPAAIIEIAADLSHQGRGNKERRYPHPALSQRERG